jgi:hypothetical protein
MRENLTSGLMRGGWEIGSSILPLGSLVPMAPKDFWSVSSQTRFIERSPTNKEP